MSSVKEPPNTDNSESINDKTQTVVSKKLVKIAPKKVMDEPNCRNSEKVVTLIRKVKTDHVEAKTTPPSINTTITHHHGTRSKTNTLPKPKHPFFINLKSNGNSKFAKEELSPETKKDKVRVKIQQRHREKNVERKHQHQNVSVKQNLDTRIHNHNVKPRVLQQNVKPRVQELSIERKIQQKIDAIVKQHSIEQKYQLWNADLIVQQRKDQQPNVEQQQQNVERKYELWNVQPSVELQDLEPKVLEDEEDEMEDEDEKQDVQREDEKHIVEQGEVVVKQEVEEQDAKNDVKVPENDKVKDESVDDAKLEQQDEVQGDEQQPELEFTEEQIRVAEAHLYKLGCRSYGPKGLFLDPIEDIRLLENGHTFDGRQNGKRKRRANYSSSSEDDSEDDARLAEQFLQLEQKYKEKEAQSHLVTKTKLEALEAGIKFLGALFNLTGLGALKVPVKKVPENEKNLLEKPSTSKETQPPPPPQQQQKPQQVPKPRRRSSADVVKHSKHDYKHAHQRTSSHSHFNKNKLHKSHHNSSKASMMLNAKSGNSKVMDKNTERNDDFDLGVFKPAELTRKMKQFISQEDINPDYVPKRKYKRSAFTTRLYKHHRRRDFNLLNLEANHRSNGNNFATSNAAQSSNRLVARSKRMASAARFNPVAKPQGERNDQEKLQTQQDQIQKRVMMYRQIPAARRVPNILRRAKKVEVTPPQPVSIDMPVIVATNEMDEERNKRLLELNATGSTSIKHQMMRNSCIDDLFQSSLFHNTDL